MKTEGQMCLEDRQLNQATSKPDPVNWLVRTARTTVQITNYGQFKRHLKSYLFRA